MLTVLTSVRLQPLPANPKGLRVGYKSALCLALAARSPESHGVQCTRQGKALGLQTNITLKSKPPWALWLLWFQPQAVGFLQTRNKVGIAPRTRGSSSALPPL